MRLWHKDLISVLPRQQLLGQWRECCAIAKSIAEKGTPNHILVNRIMNYPIEHFESYAILVYDEIKNRSYDPNPINLAKWMIKIPNNSGIKVGHDELFKEWHDYRYLRQCLFNLEEKYDCGGITREEWIPIYDTFHYKNN